MATTAQNNPSATFGTLVPVVDQTQPSTTNVNAGAALYNSIQNTVFPHDLNQNYSIILEFFSYKRPTIFAPVQGTSLGNIILPIPLELVDRQQLNYSTDEEGIIAGTVLNAAAQNGDILAKLQSGQASTVAGALSDLGSQIAAGATAGVINGALDGLGKIAGESNLAAKALQLNGLVQNPFLTVLFKSPFFKRYTMTWTFIPENAADSGKLNYIINKLKYHSVPDTTLGGQLLTYPDMVKPFLLPRGYQFDFKYCVIENIMVNYAPGDTPSFFAGTRAPTAIRLTINLLEIEYWLKSQMVGSAFQTLDNQLLQSAIGLSNGSK